MRCAHELHHHDDADQDEQAIEHAVSMGVGLREIGKVAQQTAVLVAVTE